MCLTSSLLLEKLGCQYAFYYHPAGKAPIYQANCERFASASIIKVPILLAWLHLERNGEVSRHEICNLDDEPPVQGAGFSWMLETRRLPFQDVLLLMMALSDNLCTNLVIRRIGLQRLDHTIHESLGLRDTRLQRRMMDGEARSRGLENWISARDCIHLYSLVAALAPEERAWVDALLAANQDDALLKRNIPRDRLTFYHKTGSLTGVLHDWGYTSRCQIFLLTQGVVDEPAAFEVFGTLGRLMLDAENESD